MYCVRGLVKHSYSVLGFREAISSLHKARLFSMTLDRGSDLGGGLKGVGTLLLHPTASYKS